MIPHPTLPQALRYWLRLGFTSFGGPAGQIGLMRRELVEERRWIGEDLFLSALNFCMLLPGPEAQQLATYLGWRLHGARGGIAAGALFVLPSACLLFALSWLFMAGAQWSWVGGIFLGLAPGALALVAEAAWRIGRRALFSPTLRAIAAISFALILWGQVSFVWILLGAALLGCLGQARWPGQFQGGGGHGAAGNQDARPTLELPPGPAASWPRALRILSLCLALWWAPILAAGLWLGWDSTPFRQGLFFSQAALVTVGGAYAVLPYVAQQAVEKYGWLSLGQMMNGLALAESTPGPLVIVLQFVGFVGGWQHPGAFPPLAAAAMGAAITTWATFLPSFLMVFLGAPHVEGLRRQPRLRAALAAISAAAAGVILTLVVKFGYATLWPSGRFDLITAAIAALACLGLFTGRLKAMPMLGLCAAAGLLRIWL